MDPFEFKLSHCDIEKNEDYRKDQKYDSWIYDDMELIGKSDECLGGICNKITLSILGDKSQELLAYRSALGEIIIFLRIREGTVLNALITGRIIGVLKHCVSPFIEKRLFD